MEAYLRVGCYSTGGGVGRTISRSYVFNTSHTRDNRYWGVVARMSIHLINPSDNSFGTAVITPRWLFVLAAATPRSMGDPILVDESLEQLDPETIQAGDVVGISVHTGNALRGYAVGRLARAQGATVVYGGIHATLFPEEPFEQGAAHAVVKGDGDVVWGQVLCDLKAGNAKRIYDGGKIEGE